MVGGYMNLPDYADYFGMLYKIKHRILILRYV